MSRIPSMAMAGSHGEIGNPSLNLTAAANTVAAPRTIAPTSKGSRGAREIFSEISILWGAFLSIGLTFAATSFNPELIHWLIFITLFGAFATRMFIYIFKVPNVYFR